MLGKLGQLGTKAGGGQPMFSGYVGDGGPSTQRSGYGGGKDDVDKSF
jgi:hypothetical protein